MKLDPSNPLPLHVQIRDLLLLRIARGELAPGGRLPTVRQLAVDLAVNSNTVARVYADLEQKGMLTTRRGGGTYVREAGPAKAAPSRDRRLESLCRGFALQCLKEGFTLAEARRALRSLAIPPQEEP
jgi:GntR family transcriptional regulator